MRLAIISSLLPSDTQKGGAERYAGKVSASLAEEHDVVILSGSPAGRVNGLPGCRVSPNWRRAPRQRVGSCGTRLINGFRRFISPSHENYGASTRTSS